MYNEIYCGLLNDQARNGSVGADLVSAEFHPVDLPRDVAAVRRLILVNPDLPESCNWRAAEIRRIIDKSDLNSLKLPFDARDGHFPGDVISQMAFYFMPRVTGTLAVTVYGQVTTDAYKLLRWDFELVGNTLTVSIGSTTETFTVPATGITAELPGNSGARFSLKSNSPGTSTMLVASRPSTSLAATAKVLREQFRGYIDQLAERDSLHDVETRRLLAKIAIGDETSAAVGAAALLVAGYVIKTARNDNPSLPVRSTS